MGLHGTGPGISAPEKPCSNNIGDAVFNDLVKVAGTRTLFPVAKKVMNPVNLRNTIALNRLQAYPSNGILQAEIIAAHNLLECNGVDSAVT